METVTVWQEAVYWHVERPTPVGPSACPDCGTRRVAFHSWRRRLLEHPDAERPTYLVVRLARYACTNSGSRASTSPERWPRRRGARTWRLLQAVAARPYRGGKAVLGDVAGQLRELWHTGTGKLSVLRWHRASLAADCPRPERLAFLRGAVHRRSL